MDSFIVFNNQNSNAFLTKHKGFKMKFIVKVEEKKNISIIQANIRKFLCFLKYAGPEYPLLIQKNFIEKHIDFLTNFWREYSFKVPLLLYKKILTLTFECMIKGFYFEEVKSNILNSLLTYDNVGTFLNKDYKKILLQECMNLEEEEKVIRLFAHLNILGTKNNSYELIYLLSIVKKYSHNQKLIENICQSIDIFSVDDLKIEYSIETFEIIINSFIRAAWLFKEKNEEDMFFHVIGIITIILPHYDLSVRKRLFEITKINENIYNSMKKEVEETFEDIIEWKKHKEYYLSFLPFFEHFLPCLFNNEKYSHIFLTFTNLVLLNTEESNNSFNISIELLGTFIKRLTLSNKKKNELLAITLLAEREISLLTDKDFVLYFTDRHFLSSLIKQNLMPLLERMNLEFESSDESIILSHLSELIADLYNKTTRTKLMSTEIYYNIRLAEKIMKFKRIFEENKFQRFSFLIPIAEKFEIFRYETKNLKMQHYHNNTKIVIRRGREFSDAFDQLAKNKNFKGLRIEFIDKYGFPEMGVDQGGLYKEFLNVVLKEIFNPKEGFFLENKFHELYPHPKKAIERSGQTKIIYEFVGKLLGLVLLQSINLSCRFSGSFLNAIIGHRNTFDDLNGIDAELYSSLCCIKNMKEGVSDLCLSFEFEDREIGKLIKLREKVVAVEDSNKLEYINEVANFKVNTLLKWQSRYIRKGLFEIIDPKWLSIFNSEELNYLISGTGCIDVLDLKRNTILRGYDQKDETIINFWKVIAGFSEEEKSQLLFFVTACPRPSYLGFKDLHPSFTIAKMLNEKAIHLLPTSHTCSNVLELPDYVEKELLRTKLLIAIKSGAGYGFG